MVNHNWPRDKFGVDMSRAIPNYRQNVDGNQVSNPALVQLPDDSFAQTIINSGGSYTITSFGDILVNTTAPVTIILPKASDCGGRLIGIADVGGHAQTYNITIVPDGSEMIMGQAEYVIDANYGGITLYPISTGGWYLR